MERYFCLSTCFGGYIYLVSFLQYMLQHTATTTNTITNSNATAATTNEYVCICITFFWCISSTSSFLVQLNIVICILGGISITYLVPQTWRPALASTLCKHHSSRPSLQLSVSTLSVTHGDYSHDIRTKLLSADGIPLIHL